MISGFITHKIALDAGTDSKSHPKSHKDRASFICNLSQFGGEVLDINRYLPEEIPASSSILSIAVWSKIKIKVNNKNLRKFIGIETSFRVSRLSLPEDTFKNKLLPPSFSLRQINILKQMLVNCQLRQKTSSFIRYLSNYFIQSSFLVEQLLQNLYISLVNISQH